jgi:hypothetical protein
MFDFLNQDWDNKPRPDLFNNLPEWEWTWKDTLAAAVFIIILPLLLCI